MTAYLALKGGRLQQQTFQYDFGLYAPGKPTASQVLARIVLPRAVILPSGLAGSVGSCGTAPTGTVTLALALNGTSVGSVSFAAGATIATFAAASAIDLAPGDVLTVTAPSSADATLADVSVTFTGTR